MFFVVSLAHPHQSDSIQISVAGVCIRKREAYVRI